jgi:5-formyltetrahydrofolate cyclo-ligase
VSIEADKARQRLAMRERLGTVGREFRDHAGRAMARHVLAWPGLRQSRRVALFVALRDEIPTSDLMEGLRRRGQPVLLPRAARNRLEFVEVSDARPLVRGPFGVPEPDASAPASELRADDLVLVPGISFDRTGGRLGRGAGWYDRSLDASLEYIFGVAYAFQVVEHVPVTAKDRKVRGVFTEQGLLLAPPDGHGRVPSADSG